MLLLRALWAHLVLLLLLRALWAHLVRLALLQVPRWRRMLVLTLWALLVLLRTLLLLLRQVLRTPHGRTSLCCRGRSGCSSLCCRELSRELSRELGGLECLLCRFAPVLLPELVGPPSVVVVVVVKNPFIVRCAACSASDHSRVVAIVVVVVIIIWLVVAFFCTLHRVLAAVLFNDLHLNQTIILSLISGRHGINRGRHRRIIDQLHKVRQQHLDLRISHQCFAVDADCTQSGKHVWRMRPVLARATRDEAWKLVFIVQANHLAEERIPISLRSCRPATGESTD